MKLFREILSQICLDTDVGLSLLYSVVADKGGYFQNIKGISRFSEGEILLSLPKGEVRVTGSGLRIEKYSEGDVLIRGKIVKVEQTV